VAAPVVLDLAFTAGAVLPAAPSAAAGLWADGEAGSAPWHQLLSGWLGQLAATLPPDLRAPAYSLGLNLVDDQEIAELNAHWRGQAGPTDVLAFAARDAGLEPPPPLPRWDSSDDDEDRYEDQDNGEEVAPEPLELGDIVISLDTASRQAREHGHDLTRELHVLASHGLLHLLGWDHPDDASLAAMLALQERLLT
jgi:probable rRNA maturation factor